MCLDGLRKEAMSIPFNVSASRGWKSKAGINSFLPRHTAKLSILPSLFGMPLQTLSGSTRFITVLASLSVESVIKETDPRVEYSRIAKRYIFIWLSVHSYDF